MEHKQQLYLDAMYYHLIHKGIHKYKAREKVNRISLNLLQII
jgi:hypothetical protein